ncbi:MAG: flagellin N-terminal helical domain-containing protein [Planctomycetota bacterium]
MLEIESLFKSYFQDWVFSRNYNFSDGTYGVPDNDSSVAIIREFLQGNIADVRLSAQDANVATSMTQMFVDAAITIRDKLTLMEQLAQKATNDYYTSTDKASMQKQFEQLAKDTNDIVDNTEYESNKLFTANGQVISRPLGNGQTINLFARDLTLDITNLDLTQDAKAALATIKNALKEANEYTTFLSSQNKLLQDAMATIENRIASAAGIEQSDFGKQIVQKMTSYLTAMILDEPRISSQSQSNITADEALYLLKDN